MRRHWIRSLVYNPHLQEDRLDEQFKGRFRGEACVVLAGGPSVGCVSLDALLPCRCIAVNAVTYLEEFSRFRDYFAAGMIIDAPLLKANLQRIAQAARYPVFTGNTPSDNDELLAYLTALGIHRIPANYTEGLGDSFARFSNGGNSGFAGIQLAVIMGFTTIGLLGFDGTRADGELYFHEEYTETDVTQAALKDWCARLDSCADLFELIGVTVLNLSSESSLQRYPKLSTREWRDHVGQAPMAPLDVRSLLVKRHEGRLQLGFHVNRAAAGYDGGSRNTCYGGARNVAFEGRYRPIPAVLDIFHVPCSDGDGDLLALDSRPWAGAVAPHRASTEAVVRSLAVEGVAIHERSSDPVEAWISRALEQYIPFRAGEELDLSSEALAKFEIEGRVVLLRAECRNALPLADCAATILQGRVDFLLCAICPDASAGRLERDWSREVLSSLSSEGDIVEYAELGPWLVLVLVQLESSFLSSVEVRQGQR